MRRELSELTNANFESDGSQSANKAQAGQKRLPKGILMMTPSQENLVQDGADKADPSGAARRSLQTSPPKHLQAGRQKFTVKFSLGNSSASAQKPSPFTRRNQK